MESAQNIYPAHPGAELDALCPGVVMQIDPGAVDELLAAAVFGSGDAIDILPVLAHDEHTGAVGDVSLSELHHGIKFTIC